MPLSLQNPPAVVAPAPQPRSEFEASFLEAYDWGRPLPPASGHPSPETRWLRTAVTFDPKHGVPANPFPGGPARQEAEALRHLLKAPRERWSHALQALTLRHTGTALALWRWGQAQVRGQAFSTSLRQAWEDRLLGAGPALTRSYALRHALCWALAERDEARLLALRTQTHGEAEGLMKTFQRLFALLGAPSPVLRLWALPQLEYQDLALDRLQAAHIWICPVEEGALPPLPSGTAWIIPSATGDLDERDASLSGAVLTEGQALAARLQAANRQAHFAPSRTAFEALGLAWFPILIELDTAGNIRTIRMGDAAPAKP